MPNLDARRDTLTGDGAQGTEGGTTAIVRYEGTQEARATAWASMPDDDIKREGTKAISERDHERLWSICEAYLTTKTTKRSGISRHTLRAYHRGVLDLLEAWTGENLIRPSRNAGDVYVMRLMLKSLSPGTIAVKLAAARLLYKALKWACVTTATPFDGVRAPDDPTPAWEKRHPYALEDVERMLAKAKPVDRALVLLGAHAGLRVSEMVALTWGDIDLSGRTLVVTNGKGGKRRTVYMSPALEAALERLAGTPSITGRPGGTEERVLGFSDSRARKRVARLAYRALVKYRGIHALRHTCGTRLAREKGLEAAQHHLGHQNISTTQTYAKWNQDDLRRAVEGWS